MDYGQLNQLARQIIQINRWHPPFDGSLISRPGRIQALPVLIRDEDDYGIVWRSELGVTIGVTAPVGMGDWRSTWSLSFDPDRMPETEAKFWEWVNEHIFIRYDSPETTVPPPNDLASGKLYLPDAMLAVWLLKRNPYLG